MTQNQIAYWNLQETRRNNIIHENEINRSNLAREKETNRANMRQEQLKAELQQAQQKRWQTQSGVDIANAVTGGIEKVTKAVSNIGGLLTTGAGSAKSAEALSLLVTGG